MPRSADKTETKDTPETYASSSNSPPSVPSTSLFESTETTPNNQVNQDNQYTVQVSGISKPRPKPRMSQSPEGRASPVRVIGLTEEEQRFAELSEYFNVQTSMQDVKRLPTPQGIMEPTKKEIAQMEANFYASVGAGDDKSKRDCMITLLGWFVINGSSNDVDTTKVINFPTGHSVRVRDCWEPAGQLTLRASLGYRGAQLCAVAATYGEGVLERMKARLPNLAKLRISNTSIRYTFDFVKPAILGLSDNIIRDINTVKDMNLRDARESKASAIADEAASESVEDYSGN